MTQLSKVSRRKVRGYGRATLHHVLDYEQDVHSLLHITGQQFLFLSLPNSTLDKKEQSMLSPIDYDYATPHGSV